MVTPPPSNEVLAAQLARRLCVEGAASATASGAAITFAGTSRRERPDLPAWHPLRLVATGEVSVFRINDQPRVTLSYRVQWHSRILRMAGLALLVPALFITPNGPAAVAIGVALLGTVTVRQVVARARFARWLEGLLIQEESLLARHARQLEPPSPG